MVEGDVHVHDELVPQIVALPANRAGEALVVDELARPHFHTVHEHLREFVVPTIDLPELQPQIQHVMGRKVPENLRD